MLGTAGYGRFVETRRSDPEKGGRGKFIASGEDRQVAADGQLRQVWRAGTAGYGRL